MNLRTLKKLSKRAAPLLLLLGDTREQFKAKPHENYHHGFIGERKHWERRRCHPSYEGRNSWLHKRGAEILFTTRQGRSMVMSPPSHPRKGTVMVGSMVGYYEPEWDEQDAWSALEDFVMGHFCDFDGDNLVPTRTFSSVASVIQAANEIIAVTPPKRGDRHGE
ncbi:hypothetical protein HWD97_03670 [Ochrobactrum sp. C6C9]|uniref:hypothetical protein n=1 Tax=Ochrobactrum sp. C6C9 TaxID=2736662 RepID=UPI00353020CB|nr:hypothetical protein [Ochrobactrum sp. C6C9]